MIRYALAVTLVVVAAAVEERTWPGTSGGTASRSLSLFFLSITPRPPPHTTAPAVAPAATASAGSTDAAIEASSC